MGHEQAMRGVESGDLIEAVVFPAPNANGWLLTFSERHGGRAVYTGHTGTEKIYHSLDQVAEVARDLGFEGVRVEETF